MSVCRYYLRGNCQYGNRCRFSHADSQSGSSYRPRAQINQRHHFPPPSFEHPRAPVIRAKNDNDNQILKWIFENFTNRDKAIDILKELRQEARTWEQSISFWRFTSRSLFPGGRRLQNWSDTSFEEVKWAHRCMTLENKEHVYKKQYAEYWEKVERDLVGLAKLRLETLQELKPYIDEYINSNYHPRQACSSDVKMVDINESTPINFSSQTPVTNHNPTNQTSEQETSIFDSDTFEFGQIPTEAPQIHFS